MDFQIPLIFGGIFVIASLVLVFVYKFGIKEKSYEEALAEQRQHAQTLLGVNTSSKPSTKDKKNKKAAKKGKDKSSSSENGVESGTSDSSNSKPSLAREKSESHVEFREGADEIIIKEEIKIPNTIKKKNKKDKVKSILIKDATKENLVSADREASPANHFEESHPKDEFELMRSASTIGEKTDDPPQQNTNNSNSKKDSKASKNKQQTPAAENLPSAASKNESGGSKPKEKDSGSKESTGKNKDKDSNSKNGDKKKSEPPAAAPSGVASKNNENDGKNDDPNGNKSKSQNKKQLKAQQQAEQSSVSGQQQQQQQQVQIQEKPVQQPQEAVEEKRVEMASVQQVSAAAPPVGGVAANGSAAAVATVNTGKDKKKKKSEFNTLQQIASDKNGPNISTLLNLVRKAELSRSEVQILTDLLLNKQHEAPEIVDEWSEGKSDPVQKLKRQLADKEKLLAEEQEALTGAQAKLREIRAEQQAERAQLQQKIRGYEEALQGKQVEVRGLVQQVQQLQAQVKEEAMKNHKLLEEHAAFQMQRQQLEMRIAQAQEAEVANQELAAVNQQLRVELARISEENVNGEERHQAIIVQVNNFQNELEQKTEYIRQLEEARLSFEHNLEQALRQENDFKIEISRLNSAYQQQVEELRRSEHGKKQFQDEIYRLQKQIDESEATLNQYKNDLQALEEENTALRNAQQQQQEESANSSANGSVQHQQQQEEINKEHEAQLLNLSDELRSVIIALQQTEIKYVEELKQRAAAETQLREELDEQKEKNNALRTRNWKVMEALNAAESKLKSGSDNLPNSDVRTKSDLELQHIQFVQRLYPEIKELKTIPAENFQAESEKLISKYVEDLRQRVREENQQKENAQGQQQQQQVIQELEAQLIHYKSTIDNTEKMLSNLQRHIEQEEINWRLQLAAKTAEVEAIKEQSAQLTARLSSLERELQEQREEKDRISEELEEQKSRTTTTTTTDADSSSTIKTLSEEVTRLKEQLQQEQQTKNGDIDVSPKAQNCASATNGATPLIQYCVSSSSSIASSLSEVSIKKSKIKKKRKKGNGN